MNCDGCKRELTGTLHTKDKYRVDHYRLFTGKKIPVVFNGEDGEEKKFFKIEEPTEIFVCVKCYEKSAVQKAFEEFESPFNP